MLDYPKSDAMCRKCGHMVSHHAIYLRIEQGGITQSFIKILEMVPCDSYMQGQFSVSSTKCGCLDYQPMDNLEYLELKAEQAEIKIREQDKDSW
jgi:hypothetical protein